MDRIVRHALRGVVAVCSAAALIAATAGSSSANDAKKPVCTTIPVEVTLGTGTGTMWGQLCRPAAAQPRTVQLFVHGATCNHAYWDFPYRPKKYSFRQVMNRAGYATFVVDRLGMGHSTIPSSSQLNLSLEARQIHEVVQYLRGGRIGGMRFAKVVLAGHSIGSAVVNLEASTYKDVDALLVTSLGHHVNPTGVNAIRAAVYSPNQDPKFAGKHHYDSGYATTKPGTRERIYYANLPMDPGVLVTDEDAKDVNVINESLDPLIYDPAVSRAVTAPVMFALGEHDPLYCGKGYEDCASAQTVRAQEATDWTSARSFDVFVLPNTGHGPNLAPNAQSYQAAVQTWVDRVVGTR